MQYDVILLTERECICFIEAVIFFVYCNRVVLVSADVIGMATRVGFKKDEVWGRTTKTTTGSSSDFLLSSASNILRIAHVRYTARRGGLYEQNDQNI